jgi:hypothetical protein
MNGKVEMIDLDGFARLAVGCRDAADRSETARKRNEAEALRGLAGALEEFLVRLQPPVAPGWERGRPGDGGRPLRLR